MAEPNGAAAANRRERADLLDPRQRKRLQNRAAQKTYREKLKRRIEDLERWRDLALALTSNGDERDLVEHDGPTISPGSSTGAPISQQATLSVPQPYPSPDSSKSTPAPWVVPSPSKKAPSISLDLGDLCPTAWDPVAQPDTSLDNFDLDFSETAYSGNLQPDIGGHFGAGQSIAKDMSSGGVFQNETDPNVTLQRPPLNDYATPELPPLSPAKAPSPDHAPSRNQGKTALHLACERNQLNIVRVLLKATPASSCRDSDGRTPLHLAALNGSLDVARILLGRETSSMARRPTSHFSINDQDSSGSSSLHLAVMVGHSALVDLFLDTPDADLELKDHAGHTALHLAVLHEQDSIVGKLIEHGADPNVQIGA